ncbi:hypothetical protein [Pseudomonas panipatensis]|jgi:hypothetical protein|uniref:Lipoprotein n=1 Tax=Pseudomonas panipatensis TaxID=428992 RepID=A0A1G8BKK4_9PSED|nr:hypothetical protein [Pseudomonas panipatensis]SDH33691.1 hypothetical protein SAMN05216272_101109 [Pseudomonas panipatensis]SMP71283.1 hypothetical protein SAMN06295951_11090 [Pseudomonas panipatensis]
MRRLFIALLLFLPLSGCVVYEHDHGWRGGPRYYGPPAGYYERGYDRGYGHGYDRDRDYRDHDWRR